MVLSFVILILITIKLRYYVPRWCIKLLHSVFSFAIKKWMLYTKNCLRCPIIRGKNKGSLISCYVKLLLVQLFLDYRHNYFCDQNFK